ncbi:MAG: ABC transporter permease [Prevotella sp.]|nr:ABC transporter permease [Prevotella sp.]
MIRLLKFEWRKLLRQKSLYICFGIGLFVTVLFVSLGKILAARLGVDLNATAVDSMLQVISESGFVSLLGIYLAIYACHDFAHQTIKNIYARGYSRTSVYLTKYLVSLGVTLAMAILYMIFSWVFCCIIGIPVGTLSGAILGALVLQLWVLVGMHGLFFGISMMIGKTGGSVALNLFGISFAFSILELLFQIFNFEFSILDYNLEMVLATLMTPDLTTTTLLRSLLLPLAYGVVFVSLGYWLNRRRDV